jgi:hypothetical protein
MRWTALPLLLALASATSACAGNQVQPVMVSSAGSAGYALGYPDRLAAETTMLNADKQQAAELAQGLGTRTRELKAGADPELLYVVAQQADEAGRSRAYASAFDEGRRLRTFWEEERNALTSRVSGAAQKQVTEAGCAQQPDLGGSVSYALKDGIDRQLAKRLRAQSEAHRTIELNKSALGAGNVAAVQQLADDIALSSYLVNVALVRERDRVSELLSERSDVDSTLGNAIEWEQGYQQADHTAAEKKDSQARVVDLDKSRAAIPPAASAAEEALRDLDQQIEQAREAHRAALDTLEHDLEQQKASGQAQPAPRAKR